MATVKSFDDMLGGAGGAGGVGGPGGPSGVGGSLTGDAGGSVRVVTFHVGDNLYALDINSIREIRRLPAITALPGQPEFVEGVITLRGEVIPVLDLARRMQISLKHMTAEARAKRKLIIGFVDNGVMGFIVDSVSMPDSLKKSEIAPPGELFKDSGSAGGTGPGQSGLVVGLVQRPNAAVQNDRLLILLDLKHVWGAGDSGPITETEA